MPISRQAHGFRDFENYRLRVKAVCGRPGWRIGHAVQNSLDFRFSKVLAERSDRLERIAHAGASEAALRQLGKLIEPFCRRRIKAPRNGMSCPPSKGGANRRIHNWALRRNS